MLRSAACVSLSTNARSSVCGRRNSSFIRLSVRLNSKSKNSRDKRRFVSARSSRPRSSVFLPSMLPSSSSITLRPILSTMEVSSAEKSLLRRINCMSRLLSSDFCFFCSHTVLQSSVDFKSQKLMPFYPWGFGVLGLFCWILGLFLKASLKYTSVWK